MGRIPKKIIQELWRLLLPFPGSFFGIKIRDFWDKNSRFLVGILEFLLKALREPKSGELFNKKMGIKEGKMGKSLGKKGSAPSHLIFSIPEMFFQVCWFFLPFPGIFFNGFYWIFTFFWKGFSPIIFPNPWKIFPKVFPGFSCHSQDFLEYLLFLMDFFLLF